MDLAVELISLAKVDPASSAESPENVGATIQDLSKTAIVPISGREEYPSLLIGFELFPRSTHRSLAHRGDALFAYHRLLNAGWGVKEW